MKNIKHLSKIFVFMLIIGLLAACANNGGGQAGGGNNSGGNGGSGGNEASSPAPDFPTKPIQMIVPFNAGGVSDILARAFVDAAAQEEIIDERITVVNKGGGSGTIGNYDLVKSKPDGYTWLWAATGHMSSSLHITPAQYTKDDFTIVNKVGEMTTVLVVPSSSPLETLTDFVEAAKSRPGELTIGNPGEGTVVALTAHILEEGGEIELNHVPFQGSGPLLPAVLGGHVESALMNLPEVQGQLKSGDLRALAVMTDERIDALPDVPTPEEMGVPITTGGASHFIIVPNDTPEEIVARIDELTKEVYESDRFKQLMEQAGYQLSYKNGAEAREEVDAWYEVTGELYKRLGMVE
ncbi:tripartite tricarboxylate transporter substrate binding protein [Paenibacillus senegalensis]|uniref:tripartite tricarboxylate transporter substrate binding protein n=1 Tax=Paenibacillus senegalensis TaxID=1465766 RepID=UPI00028824A2|nr:tripartite tricarboxylate transporter substrate binding protein [Paenibacillus senegalensis]